MRIHPARPLQGHTPLNLERHQRIWTFPKFKTFASQSCNHWESETKFNQLPTQRPMQQLTQQPAKHRLIKNRCASEALIQNPCESYQRQSRRVAAPHATTAALQRWTMALRISLHRCVLPRRALIHSSCDAARSPRAPGPMLACVA